jgi:hypothetical protein
MEQALLHARQHALTPPDGRTDDVALDALAAQHEGARVSGPEAVVGDARAVARRQQQLAQTVEPPSTLIVAPVTYRPSGPARNATAAATSAGSA